MGEKKVGQDPTTHPSSLYIEVEQLALDFKKVATVPVKKVYLLITQHISLQNLLDSLLGNLGCLLEPFRNADTDLIIY